MAARPEAGVDELEACRAALGQAYAQRQERAHAYAIVPPRCSGLGNGDCKGQDGNDRGADSNDDARVHQLISLWARPLADGSELQATGMYTREG